MSPWIEQLNNLRAKKSRLALGLMSGTSADAIDASLARISGHGLSARIELLHFHSCKYPKATRQKILAASKLGVSQLAELDLEIAEQFAQAAKGALRNAGLGAARIDLIGSHGQTIYHHSGVRGLRSTLQLGDGDLIASLVGSPVVSDFRRKDIAAGGEGAPITPYADQTLYGAYRRGQAILNLGGIANLTILNSKGRVVAGFDCGPANAPLDRLSAMISHGKLSFDRDGRLASQGRINPALLRRLVKEDKFLRRRGPKSSGLEQYGDQYVKRVLRQYGARADADLLATLCALIAEGVALGIKPYRQISRVVIAGGGSYNRALVSSLAARLKPIQCITSDQLGIPAYAREGLAFCLLANDFLFGDRTSICAVTGAKKAKMLGKLSLPD